MGFGKFLGDLALAGISNTGLGAAAGLIGKGASWLGRKIYEKAGVIGKHLGNLGKETLPKYDRFVWSNAADFAINHMPKGNIKDTLSKINDAAQGRVPKEHPKIVKDNYTVYNFMKPSRAERIHNWNNPTHEPKTERPDMNG